MKFKTKEELNNILTEVKDMTSNQNGTNFDKGYSLGFKTATDVAFKSFAERVEFYKRYKMPEELIANKTYNDYMYTLVFWDEQQKLCKIFLESEKGFNDWLFDYCFGDVIE